METIQCSCESDNVGIFPCAGIQVHKHIVLTELGVKKLKNPDMKPTEVKDIMEQVKALL